MIWHHLVYWLLMSEMFDLWPCDLEIHVHRGHWWYHCTKRGLYLVYLHDKRTFTLENIRSGLRAYTAYSVIIFLLSHRRNKYRLKTSNKSISIVIYWPHIDISKKKTRQTGKTIEKRQQSRNLINMYCLNFVDNHSLHCTCLSKLILKSQM